MIFIYHSLKKIATIEDHLGQPIALDFGLSIAEGLFQLAVRYPNSCIVWCAVACQDNLNVGELSKLFHHDKLLLSYDPNTANYLGNMIGYVDESLFVKVNKKVCFPTWQMSSAVGMIHASVVLAVGKEIPFNSDFDYYLNSLAKLLMPKGLLCYSEPQLFKNCDSKEITGHSNFILFRFVKQHYKTRWIFILLFNLFFFEKKLLVFPFLASFFYKKRNNTNINLDKIPVASSRKVVRDKSIDVIIPTIGRKAYLYAVLHDLAKQTLLPEKVIIVEQNPIANSISELDYLVNERWPFEIKHIFTHQAGACNARNVALKEVKSEWVFLADDDIVFESNFFKEAFYFIEQFGAGAVSFRCLRKGEKTSLNTVVQWISFGSGCSIVASRNLNTCSFGMGYEFGYGEDSDFGMQLRNQGHDILYFPEPSILHLKAPIGGFRIKPILKWGNDKIQPKPSPTVMLYLLSNATRAQFLGYKTILFFKYYQNQALKSPFSYYINFKKQWNSSVFWANELNCKE
ncbi:glycosyltransferase involved in cell wall biosynthesis [Flavobacterium sp. 28A]|uniref:glycosyltransferase family 2 protein n=1 Tax=Flavobacterium sp. 28A TaxID=2735895 RepID=UPI001C2D304D|nr:glycosyltransferase [Flavobacterium sp. 28A]NRT15150.1 glycosyltransferase involved in cell wall biosynthesis [Flavobacterium sp. 28A]